MLNVSQVETVGDKYMAVSGLPDPCHDHARSIARLALDMMDMAPNLKDPDGLPFKVETANFHLICSLLLVIGYFLIIFIVPVVLHV